MPRKRVVVAMSGGVDSSLAAALLKKDGYDVIGITMQVWPAADTRYDNMPCCGLDAIDSARNVASQLGIPHYVTNFRDIFALTIIADFCDEYRRGRTPNPCIRCNQYIKFDALLRKAQELDADFIATGHYAQIRQAKAGYQLLKAADREKDQTYFLYTLGQQELKQILMPVGGLNKDKVRQIAKEMALPSASRQESQDICFIPDNDFRKFIAEHVPLIPGDIVDTKGKVLGKHSGLAQYTVGQRQGLGLAARERLYILALDTANNRLVVGSREDVFRSRLTAGNLCWVSGLPPQGVTKVTAKIRSRAPEAQATLEVTGDTAIVTFSEPQWAATPGQAVVFYQEDAVLGGGTIETSLPQNETTGRGNAC